MPLNDYFVDFYEEIRAKAPIFNSHYRQIVIDETLARGETPGWRISPKIQHRGYDRNFGFFLMCLYIYYRDKNAFSYLFARLYFDLVLKTRGFQKIGRNK